MNIRNIDITKDRDTLLQFHCRTNYESGSPLVQRKTSFEEYTQIYLSSKGVEEYLTAFAKSLEDQRTIAEFREESGRVVAYIWVVFYDYSAYKETIAQIEDILVIPEYQRQGIASEIIRYVEKTTKERGATILSSGTGMENVKSQKLHKKMGLNVHRVEFEKRL
ncbi:MAG: GNAT family N-acetyltransferase [Dehalococcoidales bacterium]|nr:GNAT family N-acetyltransferase [Dehalococcoidales bacterium]